MAAAITGWNLSLISAIVCITKGVLRAKGGQKEKQCKWQEKERVYKRRTVKSWEINALHYEETSACQMTSPCSYVLSPPLASPALARWSLQRCPSSQKASRNSPLWAGIKSVPQLLRQVTQTAHLMQSGDTANGVHIVTAHASSQDCTQPLINSAELRELEKPKDPRELCVRAIWKTEGSKRQENLTCHFTLSLSCPGCAEHITFRTQH